MAKLPQWADQKLSEMLPALREQGEGQTLEYKRAIPDNKWSLAREIAGFATANDGLILIGVADDGSLVGLDDLETAEKRDALCRRVEGICSGVVKPFLTPSLSFLQEDGKTVLAIAVKKTEPVYFCGGVPYIRNITESRPAEPHEVAQKYREAWGLPEIVDPLADLAHRATDSIFRIIESASAVLEGRAPQNLSLTQAEFEGAAESLRSLAASDESINAGWADELMTLADLAEDIAESPPFLDPESIAETEGKILRTMMLATEFYQGRIGAVAVPSSTVNGSIAYLRRNSRELSQIAQKIKQEGGPKKLSDVQQKAGLIGFYIRTVAYWGLHKYPEVIVAELRSIARRLRAIEGLPLFIDGGASKAKILGELFESDSDLAKLVDRIEAENRQPRDADGR